MPTFTVQPQGLPGCIADVVMAPFMLALQGFFPGCPQRTHFWNNTKFKNGELDRLRQELMIEIESDPKAGPPWLGIIPVMHIPILPGGWREYVVLEPRFPSATSWFVGWTGSHVAGVSRIPLGGPVRVLRSPTSVRFFGINARDGRQIPLSRVGLGNIWSFKHRSVPLR